MSTTVTTAAGQKIGAVHQTTHYMPASMGGTFITWTALWTDQTETQTFAKFSSPQTAAEFLAAQAAAGLIFKSVQ